MHIKLSNLLNGQTVSIDNHMRVCSNDDKWDEKVHLHKEMDKDEKRKGVSVKVHLNQVLVQYTPKHISKEIKAHLESEIRDAFCDNETERKRFIAEICDVWAEINKVPLPITEDKLSSLKGAILKIANAFGIKARIKNKMIESSVAFFELANEYKIGYDAKNGKRVVIGKNKDLLNMFVKKRNRKKDPSEYQELL